MNDNFDAEPGIPDFTIQKLTGDLKKAAYTLSHSEARFLVDAYYIMQEDRKRLDNQVRSMQAEPHEILYWLADNSRKLEDYIKVALDVYSGNNPVGQWARDQVGIGPVITAGLLAYIDITKCQRPDISGRSRASIQKWSGQKGKSAPIVQGLKRSSPTS